MTRNPLGTHPPLFVIPEGNLRLLLLLPFLSASILLQQPLIAQRFSFPGPATSASSSNGQFTARYKKLSGDEFSFYITDRAGAVLSEHKFTRSVAGAWSPRADNLFLNDYMGSTQIDCLVWTPEQKSLLSLTTSLLSDPASGPVQGNGAKPPENPSNSRFELTCGSWQSSTSVSMTLQGTTWAGGQFSYSLTYDIPASRFSWRATQSKVGRKKSGTQIPFGNDKAMTTSIFVPFQNRSSS